MAAGIFDDLLKSASYAGSIGPTAWSDLRAALPGRNFELWLDGLERLAHVDDTPAVMVSFATASLALLRRFGVDACLGLGLAATSVARATDARTLKVLLDVIPLVARAAKDHSAFRIWLRTIGDLAGLAPESVQIALLQAVAVFDRLGAAGFRSWAMNGIQVGDGDAARRIAYYSHTDIAELAAFARQEGDVLLADVEHSIKSFGVALWRIHPVIRTAAIRPGAKAPRRSSFEGHMIRLPEMFGGYRGAQAVAHYHAALAHIGAHMVHTRERFPRGSLKPLQLALVGLIEDARVEALAIREFPGLRRLWQRFHTAQAGVGLTAEFLMTRLSRALIDPAYRDDDPWVTKGRAMFFDNRQQWDRSAISREIGNLLGNDLGQMRIQFNSKSYVVEPSYHDDHSGLWQLDDQPPEEALDAETVLESVRITKREQEDERQRHERDENSKSQASMAARVVQTEADQGIPLARHPEWDHVSGVLRNEWTTVLEYAAKPASAQSIDSILEQYADVQRRITRLVRSAEISRPRRMRRQPQGDRLDLDACIRATIDRRSGMTPDHRIYEIDEMRARDLSVLLLLDISESTRDRVKDTTTTVLAMERAAAAILAQAMNELADPFAIHAFCSNGRSEVRYYRVKDFGDSYSAATRARLAGLRGMLSTRLGAALRQASAEIAPQTTHRKLVLVITDGEPADIDTPDHTYLVEDARKAVHELSQQGIDAFCVGLDSGSGSHLPRIFGGRNFLRIGRIEALPEKLPMLYFRLTV